MLIFIIQRSIQAIIVMLFVSFISFGLFQFIGDPVSNLASIHSTVKERDEIRDKLGLNKPFYSQYFNYLTNILNGDFGKSYKFRKPVIDLIIDYAPATIELSIIAALLSLIIGIPTGVYTGIKPNSFLTHLLMFFSLTGVSIPSFLLGILFIFLFSVTLNWLPSFGRGEVVQIGFWQTGLLSVSGLKALILPSITLCLFQLTLVMRLVRSEMLEILRTDYIKFAFARGLKSSSIYFVHALKNALIPVITISGLQLGTIIAFAVVTETVFQWPGLGLLFIQAISFADMPVVATYLLVVAGLFVTINLIVDILYYLIDPRLRSNNKLI